MKKSDIIKKVNNSHHIQISYLDGLRFERAVLAGCREVISHEKDLNKINVFPIPDNDTGSNLKKTFLPILNKYPLLEAKINKSSQHISDTAVISALGYSGIIFSQFLSGIAEGIKDQVRILIKDLGNAASQAVIRAYESMSEPVEGTVLSVFKEWSDEVNKLTLITDDFVLLLRESFKRAASALAKTTQQLEILKKHKVVDAGGQAFIYFLEGIIHYIEEGKLQPLSIQKKQVLLKKEKVAVAEKDQFCAECCVRRANLDRPSLIEKLNSLGQDLIFYSSLNFAKIHIRTSIPEEIYSCVAQFGEVASKKIFKFEPELPSDEKKALALTSDTVCDITDEYIENNNIYFIPVKFQAMDKVFTDKVDIIPEEFYQIMSSSPTLPKTSQPSLADFTRFYEHLLVHYKSIISVQLSGALSGTLQTALQAANNIDPQRIPVLDGKNISVGLGLIVMEGVKAIKERLDYEDVLKRMKSVIEDVEIFIGIPTLKYLIKGGRITKAKGFIGGILNINPILSINKEGALEPIGKTRGKKRLEQKVFDIALEKITKKEKAGFSVAVAHTNAPRLGKKVAEKIKERLGKEVVMVMNASPALGAHAGPGAVGIAILKKVTPKRSNSVTQRRER